MKKINLIFCLLIIQLAGFSQMTIHFIDNEDAHPDSFYFKIYTPLNTQSPFYAPRFFSDSITSYTKMKHGGKATVTYQIPDTTIGFFADLFGKETIVIPNDTLTIQVKRRGVKNDSIKINKKYFAYWAYDCSYDGKNKYIYALPDTLTYYTGYVFKYFIPYNPDSYNLNRYYDTVTSVYTSRIQLINSYAANYHIPPNIVDLVKAECYAAYIINLLIPLPENDFLPEKYINTLNNVEFEKRFLFKTPLYHDAFLDYVEKYEVKYLQHVNDPEAVFRETYARLKNDYPLSNTGAILTSRYLIKNEKKHFAGFDSLCINFKQFYPYAQQIPIIDSLLTVHHNKNKITKAEAFNALLLTGTMKFATVNNSLNGKPTIINCWASWCSPCMQEIPLLQQMTSLYKDSIQIIYLSFDNNKNDWLKKQEALGITENSYLLVNNFKSDLATYFDIHTIPRLILLDAAGNIVNQDVPRPNHPAFQQIIHHVLIKE